MYNKTFNFRTTQGTPIIYQRGKQVVFEGKVYTCLQDTSNTPFQKPSVWSFVGMTETYYGDNPPLHPQPNQMWVSTSGIMYTYINDGNSSQWIQL